MPKIIVKIIFLFSLLFLAQSPLLDLEAKNAVLLAKKTSKKKPAKKKSSKKIKRRTTKKVVKRKASPLEDIEFYKKKIAILPDKINTLKQSLKSAKHRKKIRDEIRKTKKELLLAKQKVESQKKELLTNYEQKKTTLKESYNDNIKQYNSLKNKPNKTEKEFKELIRLAKDVAMTNVSINHISNVLRQLKLSNLYERLFLLKPKLKTLFDTIVGHETQLLQTNDYYQQYDLESKINQAYAEAITIENQVLDLEKKIGQVTHIYLNNVELYLAHYKSVQAADKTKYAELMHKLKNPQSQKRNPHQLRASQDRLDHITWWVEQDLAFLNNPSHTRLKQRPIASKEKVEPFKLNTSISQVIGLYSKHYNQSKLSEMKSELIKEQNRLKNRFSGGQLSYQQLQDVRRHEDDLRNLLAEVNRQLDSFNTRSRDPYPRDFYPRDTYPRDIEPRNIYPREIDPRDVYSGMRRR